MGKCYLQVFSFGSVPLKTYLPDGDIDLTVLTKKNMEDKFFQTLYDMLKSEEEEEGESEFHVTDVQFIPAQVYLLVSFWFWFFIFKSVPNFTQPSLQVKVIKCNIRNIAVDISFNQMAGLCALCFLEQVPLAIQD